MSITNFAETIFLARSETKIIYKPPKLVKYWGDIHTLLP
jgi:hypothetical protein